MPPQELPSTSRAYGEPLVDFRQLLCTRGTLRELSMHLRDLLSAFRACTGPSVDFRQPLSIHGTFHHLSMLLRGLSSAFSMAAVLSVNLRQLFVHHKIFRKQSARPQNLPSTSVDLPCICGTYRKLGSICREAGGPPVNFPSTRLTYCQLSLRKRDLSTSFNFPLLLGSSGSSTEFPTLNS